MGLKVFCVVPTLDRQSDLKNLARSFREAEVPSGLEFCVLVVDNSTEESSKSVFDSLDFGVKSLYLSEKRKGLSNARNFALKHIEDSDYVCTIDDDIVVPSSFFYDLWAVIKGNPRSVIIGGRVELYNKQDLPITIKTRREFLVYDPGSLFGFVFGCAMVIKSEAFAKVGFFDPLLGAGTFNGGSEDSDFVFRVWNTYHRASSVVYDPRYYVYHNHGRRDPSFKDKLFRNYFLGQGGLIAKHVFFLRNREIIKFLYWDARKSVAEKGFFACWAWRIQGMVYYSYKRLRG